MEHHEIERGDIVRTITRWCEQEGEVSVIDEEGFFIRVGAHSFSHFRWSSGDIYTIVKKREDIPMSEVGDIRKQLSEMTEEELQELIRGKRKLRREQPKAAASKPRKTQKAKAKDRMADVMAQMKSLPESEKEALLKALGG